MLRNFPAHPNLIHSDTTETADMNSTLPQFHGHRPRLGMMSKTKQGCSADDLKSGRHEDSVQSLLIGRQAGRRRGEPSVVAERCPTDLERRTRNRPGAELVADAVDKIRSGDGKAQAQASQSIGFAEGPQHDRPGRHIAREACRGGSRSMKASSTTRRLTEAARARRGSGDSSLPLGLFGLTTTAISARPASSSVDTTVTSCPVFPSRPRALHRLVPGRRPGISATSVAEAGSGPVCRARRRSSGVSMR